MDESARRPWFRPMMLVGVAYVAIGVGFAALAGLRCGVPASIAGMPLDAVMATWPVPSLARTKGTLLAAFAASQFARTLAAFGGAAEPFDAYLYLGPPRLLLAAPVSTHAFLDTAFVTKLRRRASVMAGGNYHDDRIEMEKVRAAEGEVFACRTGS
jgi:hypothetical protein